jgi:imidazole glycerol-phosphate synthase subunit HisH
MMKIGIINYGLGNLTSVAGAVNKVGYDPIVSDDAAVLAQCDKLILPGVGAFGDGMAKLNERNLVDPLNELVIEQGKPILGICLGSQLLCHTSSEFGEHQGLGWIDAEVRRLPSGDAEIRVPHVGWNDLFQTRSSVLLTDIPDDALFYYVHSYYIDADAGEAVCGECEYGVRFTAALEKGNIFATQFHPEKSQRHGLTLMRNFLELVE